MLFQLERKYDGNIKFRVAERDLLYANAVYVQKRSWFGIYEDNRLVFQFNFGGEYWFQHDKPLLFGNTEFITIEYQSGFFYALANAEVLGLTSNNQYVNASIEFSFSEDDMKVNLSNLRINPSSKGLASFAIRYNFAINATFDGSRIDYYSASSYLIGSAFKNTKINIMLIDRSLNFNLNIHTRLGPFVIDRPMNNSTEAVSFFRSPFGPMIILADSEGDLQVHTFYSLSHKINPLGRVSNFYVFELDAVGFKKSMVTAELGFANNLVVLNLNSYSYDFGKTLWVNNIWQNMTNIEFELDNHNNSAFLSTSAVNREGALSLNVLHFNNQGKLKSEVNLVHHTLVKTFFANNKLTLITRLDGKYSLVTISIEPVNVIAQFIANLVKVFQSSSLINAIGLSLISLLMVHELRKRTRKTNSTELYPID